MNNIWCIAVQFFALFTVAVFLEAVKFGVERLNTYDHVVSVERTVVHGILLGFPLRIRTCFSNDVFGTCYIRAAGTSSVRFMCTFNSSESIFRGLTVMANSYGPVRTVNTNGSPAI